MNGKELVKAGYESIAAAYAEARLSETTTEDVKLLDSFLTRVRERGLVLDAGCGSGVPIARNLTRSFRVIGIDFARAQLRLLREAVPAAAPVCGDISRLPFRDSIFDGVCSYYAIIHLPREQHAGLIREIHRVLKMSGAALLCMGEYGDPGSVDDYLGTRMFWSHFDSETNERMVRDCGFEILWSRPVADSVDPPASHRFLLARKSTENKG